MNDSIKRFIAVSLLTFLPKVITSYFENSESLQTQTLPLIVLIECA